MNNQKSAINIARTYMLTHGGEMPLIVVGFNERNESMALLGSFRKKHELDDQKTFCAILRMAFIANHITEYYVLAKSQMTLSDDTSTETTEELPVLIVVGVDSVERHGKIFQLGNGDRVEITEVMDIYASDESAIQGMFMQLLPERSAILPPNLVQGIEYYVNQIRYIVPEVEEPQVLAKPSGIEALFQGWNA
jgi:hypothetical protein